MKSIRRELWPGEAGICPDGPVWGEADGEVRGDGFALEFSGGVLTVRAATPRARRFAAAKVAALAGTVLRPGRYVFEPEFAVRGIIEGFYGRPWTMAQRRRALSLLARHGMNAYFYGPKDDPFHRERWGEQYEGDAADTLRGLITLTEENGMEFRYMLAPGLSIRYTSAEDRARLKAKYAQVYGFGVRRFGLLLDDLERAELYPEDAAVFARQVDAHADLVRDVWAFLKELDPDSGLIVCPTQYWGDSAGAYVSALGRGIDPAVELFWTGPYICSDELTVAAAEKFSADTGHAPLYWDNYPVNDAEMVDELHLLPYTGREAGLGAVCRGLVANPMELAESSLVPLLTVADRLWDGARYDPEESFSAALAELCGAEAPGVRTLARMCHRSCLTRAGQHFAFEEPTGRDPGFEAALAAGAGETAVWLEERLGELEALAGSGSALAAECRRWIDAAADFCRAGAALARTGDGAGMRRFLRRSEDVMKREARKMLDIFEKTCKI